MKTKNIVVRQRVLRCVEAVRTLIVEVPEKSSLNPHWLRRLAENADQCGEPFFYSPVEGTEYLEPLSTSVIGETTLDPDLPYLEGRV